MKYYCTTYPTLLCGNFRIATVTLVRTAVREPATMATHGKFWVETGHPGARCSLAQEPLIAVTYVLVVFCVYFFIVWQPTAITVKPTGHLNHTESCVDSFAKLICKLTLLRTGSCD